jgi:hypothetical protein
MSGYSSNDSSNDATYLFSDFEKDHAEWFTKNQEEPFLYKLKDILYPNPEFLSESVPDDLQSKKIHLCIFYIEKTCVLPFVKYAVLPDEVGVDEVNKTVQFAEFSIDSSSELSNLEKQVEQQFQILFENYISDPDHFDHSYKGFFERNDNLYLFIDITQMLENKMKLAKTFIYAVAHELCTLKSVFDYSLGQNIQDMFDVDEETFPKCAIVQPWFYNPDGILEMIEIPHIGYICSLDDSNELHNLTNGDLTFGYKRDSAIGTTGTVSGSLGTLITTDCLIEYEDLGLNYYLSEDILYPVENEYYVRFVIFAMKTKEVNPKKKHGSKGRVSLRETVGSKGPLEYNTIVFESDKTRVWGVKSIDQIIPV